MKRRLIIAATVLVAVAFGLWAQNGVPWFNNLYPATNSMGWPNPYRPTSPTNPTVGAGIDLSEELKNLGLPDSLSRDINGFPRPKGKWDIGAYQYPQTNLAAPTHFGATQTGP